MREKVGYIMYFMISGIIGFTWPWWISPLMCYWVTQHGLGWIWLCNKKTPVLPFGPYLLVKVVLSNDSIPL